MAENRRRDAMTAAMGLSGVGASSAVRHYALEDAYGEKGLTPVKRPRIGAELRLIHHPAGRKKWLAGLALGSVSLPPAAVGTHRLLTRPDKRGKKVVAAKRDRERKPRRTLLQEGLIGVKDSLLERNESWREPKPKKLILGNYAAGVGVGSAATGLSQLSMRKTKLSGGKKAAISAVAGTAAGSLSLPLQSRITRKISRGRYEVTPTGVRRRKPKPVRPSSKAGIGGNVAKIAVHSHGGLIKAGYVPRRTRASDAAAKLGAQWTTKLSGASDLLEHYPAKHRKLRAHPPARLVKTGRSKAATTVRAVAYDAAGLQDRDRLVRQTSMLAKRENDPGAGMTRSERRLRFTASGGVPLIGDVTSGLQAGRLAPKERRRKVSAQQTAANVGSAATGNIAGGIGAAALAARHPSFDRKATAASNWVDAKVDRARGAVGMKPANRGPGKINAAMQHPKVPKPIRSAAKLVAARPKVAAIGALAGGLVAGNVGSQLHYGHVMTQDDRYRSRAHNSNPNARRGRGKVTKAEGRPLSQKEKQQLARRKRRNAVMLTFTGTTGLGSLATTTGEKVLRTSHPKVAAHLGRATIPLLTAGAGVGGFNAYTGAKIQRREAATLSKRLPGNKAAWARWSKGNTERRIDLARHASREDEARSIRESDRHFYDNRKKRVYLYPTGGRQVSEEWDTASPRRIGKAFGMPRVPRAFPTGIRRAKTMRAGFIRQTRNPTTGVRRVSSVRGGLG